MSFSDIYYKLKDWSDSSSFSISLWSHFSLYINLRLHLVFFSSILFLHLSAMQRRHVLVKATIHCLLFIIQRSFRVHDLLVNLTIQSSLVFCNNTFWMLPQKRHVLSNDTLIIIFIICLHCLKFTFYTRIRQYSIWMLSISSCWFLWLWFSSVAVFFSANVFFSCAILIFTFFSCYVVVFILMRCLHFTALFQHCPNSKTR